MATRGADVILLVGRVLLAVLFLMTVWSGGPSADYLKSLGYFAPAAMSVFAQQPRLVPFHVFSGVKLPGSGFKTIYVG